MAAGLALYSGASYVYALADSEVARHLVPCGGLLLFLAWASMLL
jgi:uncharacterized membrane protein YgdD (TMEM256/DUF423 family)